MENGRRRNAVAGQEKNERGKAAVPEQARDLRRYSAGRASVAASDWCGEERSAGRLVELGGIEPPTSAVRSL